MILPHGISSPHEQHCRRCLLRPSIPASRSIKERHRGQAQTNKANMTSQTTDARATKPASVTLVSPQEATHFFCRNIGTNPSRSYRVPLPHPCRMRDTSAAAVPEAYCSLT